MSKPANRSYSRYSREAVELLGLMIRQARINRQMTSAELAERAGISRGLLLRIERGDLGCAIGAVFEVAAVVELRLFDQDQTQMTMRVGEAIATMALLPQAVRASAVKAKDDF